MHDDGTHLWVGSKLGVTVIDFENSVSTDYELPQGHDLHDMVVLESHIVMVTEGGVWIADIIDGSLGDISQWSFYQGRYTAGAQLVADGGDDYVIALGFGGFGSVFQINELSITQLSVGNGISDAMSIGNATATSIVLADVSS